MVSERGQDDSACTDPLPPVTWSRGMETGGGAVTWPLVMGLNQVTYALSQVYGDRLEMIKHELPRVFPVNFDKCLG